MKGAQLIFSINLASMVNDSAYINSLFAWADAYAYT